MVMESEKSEHSRAIEGMESINKPIESGGQCL